MIDPEFSAALQKNGYELDAAQAERIEAYVRLVWTLNESINLTRHTTWGLFVERDLRDCLQLSKLIATDEDVLDLGSGGGVPGIPLAILRPDIRVSLAESVGKRAKVLDEMVSDLNLPIAVYSARGEELLEDFRFSTLVSRAVGSLRKLCEWVEPHWESLDRMLIIKGPKWVEERAEARHVGVLKGVNLRIAASYPPGDGENEGVILQIWPKGRELAKRFGAPGQAAD
jgi:16S rRNA (guanine527-N7)-methyltransferase